MPQPLDSKGESLRHQGALNPHPQKVADPLFLRGEFFDPRDLVQVKYEMLRRVRVEGASVTEVLWRSGSPVPFSIRLGALSPRRPAGLDPSTNGTPSGPQTLRPVVEFLLQHRLRDPLLRAPALSELVREHFGLVVHPRSIERALSADEKKSHVIPDAPQDQIPVLPDELWTTRYEELRKRAMAKSCSIDQYIWICSLGSPGPGRLDEGLASA